LAVSGEELIALLCRENGSLASGDGVGFVFSGLLFFLADLLESARRVWIGNHLAGREVLWRFWRLWLLSRLLDLAVGLKRWHALLDEVGEGLFFGGGFFLRRVP